MPNALIICGIGWAGRAGMAGRGLLLVSILLRIVLGGFMILNKFRNNYWILERKNVKRFKGKRIGLELI